MKFSIRDLFLVTVIVALLADPVAQEQRDVPCACGYVRWRGQEPLEL